MIWACNCCMGWLELSPLGMGIIAEIFHSFGTSPDSMDLLKKSTVIPLAIDSAVDFSITADIPSGPVAFHVSSVLNMTGLHLLCKVVQRARQTPLCH